MIRQLVCFLGLAALSAGCAGFLDQGNSKSSRGLELHMGVDGVVSSFGKTECRVETLFHWNPAEAWGYRILSRRPGQRWPRLESVPCDRADYWVYFEERSVVGWTQ